MSLFKLDLQDQQFGPKYDPDKLRRLQTHLNAVTSFNQKLAQMLRAGQDGQVLTKVGHQDLVAKWADAAGGHDCCITLEEGEIIGGGPDGTYVPISFGDDFVIIDGVVHLSGSGGGGTVVAIGQGFGILVDSSDPTAPIISLDQACVPTWTGHHTFMAGFSIHGVATFTDGVEQADIVFAAPDATSDKELQLFGGTWTTDFDTSEPTRGVRLGGSYLAFESTDISMQLNTAQVGCRVVVAGITERGNAILAVEAPPTPDYIENVTNSSDVIIYAAGPLPSAWVDVCDLMTITQDVAADTATVFLELLVENTGTKDGVFEIGISLNGAPPTAVNSIQYALSAGIQQIFANTSINANFLPNGTTARLQARGISAHATGFVVVARNSVRPSRLKLSVVGTGGGAIGGNPTSTIGLTVVNGSALTWMRSDAAPPLSQAIVPTWSALHTFSLTPVVPDDSWTYAKLQNVSATNRVLGRISVGAGDVEELTPANLITIIGGAGGFPVGANPTGTIGLTVVNGAAATFMRSDAAPALSQAIIPTWTGAHTFNGAVNFSSLFKASGVEGLEGQVWASQGIGLPPVWRNAGSGSIDLTFKFNSSTAGTDPGNTYFALNTASYATVTSIVFDTLTIGGFDASTILSILVSGNRLYIQQINDATRAAVFEVTGPATDHTGWWSVPVTFIKTTVAGALFQNNQNCTAVFILSSSSTALANPTATIGLTAINGSAATAMRSDAAPPLSQAIIPTWTGAHKFMTNTFFGTTASLSVGNTALVQQFGLTVQTASHSIVRGAADTGPPRFAFGKTRSVTYDATVAVQAADVLGEILFVGADGTNMTGGAQILAVVSGTVGLGVMPTEIRFLTDNAAGTNTERFRMSDFGGLGVAGANYGTAGQTLTSGGAAAAASWSNPALVAANFANPTGTIGLTVVNGSAVTAMRSDAAPPLSQAIIPTWTGKHTFTFDYVAGSSAVEIACGVPILAFNETDAAVDARRWLFSVNSSQYNCYAATDNDSALARWLQVVRTLATITSISFGNATDNPAYNFLGTGNATFSGSVIGSPAIYATDGSVITKIQSINSTPSGMVGTQTNHALEIRTNNTIRATWGASGGMFTAGATGGNQGAGTINATGLYVNGVAVGGGASSGANPTASVGLTAVNGAAVTFMRSDAAPPLSQAIVPTWTGQHTFAGGTSGIDSAIFSGTEPTIRFIDTDAPADEKNWRVLANASLFRIGAMNDALGVTNIAFIIARSGATITNLSFGNATNNPTYSFLGTGTATFNGAVIAVGGFASLTAEGLRTVHSSGYLSWYNTAGSTRTGYIQMVATDAVYFSEENAGARFIFATSTGEKLRIDNNALNATGQVRATGWYTTNAAVGGPAAEIGCAGGTATLIGYNRTGSVYIPLSLAGTTITIAATAGAVAVTGTSFTFNGVDVSLLGLGNWGQLYPHGTYTDFNSTMPYGATFVQSTTNGPTNPGAAQYYHMRVGLGDAYTNLYAMDLAFSRIPSGGSPYIFQRFMEGSAWGSWAKTWAGIADNLVTVNNSSVTAMWTLTNTSATGQSPLDFVINSTMRARIRADYGGNLSYVCNGGNHDWWMGGDSGTGTIRMRLTTTTLDLQSKRAIDFSDSWLRLNQQADFTSGTYSPGLIRSGDHMEAPYFSEGGGTTRKLYPNLGAMSYGTVYVNGAQGGHSGYAINDSGVSPTFMSDTVNAGIHIGSDGKWLLYRSGSSTAVSNYGITAVSFTASSSRKLKRETGTPRKSWDILRRLRPILYRMLKGDDHEQLGLIAEEVHEVCPQLSDGKSVAYDRLAILLLAAWQDEHPMHEGALA